ncbi:hypothetical protein FFJ24_010040 [Pedobacter sp. KBS0701]|uniref:hypothetical protein n=1 Tax=Pedobacter sp. KBS0701 TaxID=2578106 RepID=UPI00110F642C|nr:hypothetical protein [Pedobacter sp. KBS0701]QDW25132.1 hypothetical protein FFJ24_010040 [Pedobacter sp. KBS0701]
MKALPELTNTMKGRLLFELFPDEMPALLDHLAAVCADFRTNHEEYKKNWRDGFMSFDYWFSLSEECAALLKKHGHTMRKNSKVFSDQLFYGYTALFVNDRIVKYAAHSASKKFKQAVELLYT